jgi:hypothetical protein
MLSFIACGNSSAKVVGEYDVSKLGTDFGGAEAYGIYGCQLPTEDKELRNQCLTISSFLDIYESSFK